MGSVSVFIKKLSLCAMPGAAFVLFACDRLAKEDEPLFKELAAAETGITFLNTVRQSGDNNVLNYPYYFNGGGVAVGDINNDGLIDIYFSGNQVANKLYLNKGDLIFEDITEQAGVSAAAGWKTGVTMADVNQDGWLDLYVCRSAMSDSTLRENLLYINNKDLTFTEQAGVYGLADNSYTTHAAFFDYDRDGDPDLFILNHSLPQYGGFSKLLGSLKKQDGKKFGSKLFQNDGGTFRDVSAEAGIISNVLSFGLGVAISDLNSDGWPDVYVSNDFNEEDYLYINNGDGTFGNTIKDATGHVSLFSMGSDVADINNDARPDIFTLDMLPETNNRIKLSSGDDNYDKYRMLIGAGFHHQSMRNMLQLNNGDGTFSEIGQLAGISNTDWSWAALFADFDGDGWKDLFVTNGYEKDYTNMQFLKFTVDEQIKARKTGASPDVDRILDSMPSIEVGNCMFRNNGDLTFSKTSEAWGIGRKFKSNGAACADLDNDGDQDLVINVMNGPAVVYRNNSVEKNKANFLKIDVTRYGPNPAAGTKIFCYTAEKKQLYEFFPDRGFQSCMYAPVHIGTGPHTVADSVRIIWPDNKTQLYKDVPVKHTLMPRYEQAGATYLYEGLPAPLFEEVRAVDWTHLPAGTNDFKRQFLLPKMYSYSGPRMATADVDGDGREDIYICGPKDQPGGLFVQQSDASFAMKKIAAFEADMGCQDEDAVFFDADSDGDPDLYVVSGGYLFKEHDRRLQDRLYINDGKGNFSRHDERLPPETLAGSCVVPFDLDGDHDTDLFVGSRMVPGRYPVAAPGLMLVNDGTGHFTERSEQVAPALQHAGMVCDAVAADLDGNKMPELIIAGEWMPIRILANRQGVLVDETAQWFTASTAGWWNCLLAGDFDGDGDTDLVGGNYGMNNQFHVSPERPSGLVYKDFDNDSQIDPFFYYYIGDREYPYASRDEALGQVSFLKQRFTDYTQYADATLETIFEEEELQNVGRLKAEVLNTTYFENRGDAFEAKDLPVQVQFAPVYAMAGVDVDRDGDTDIVMAGNESNVRVRLGRSDANRGVVLLNDGHGGFSYVPQYRSGLNVAGDVRSLAQVGDRLIMGINNAAVRVYRVR